MKYKIDATVMLSLESVIIHLDEPASEELEFHDALLKKLNKQLTLLDIKGSRSGDDGFISSMDCESIDNWEREGR